MKPDSPKKPLTMRCSTVFVAEGGEETQIFRSIDDIPVRLRARLFDPSRGGGSATIFIANRGGREELARRFKGLPSSLKTRLERGLDRASRSRATRPVKSASPEAGTKSEGRILPEPPQFASLSSQERLAPALRLGLMVAAGGALLLGLLRIWQ